MSNLDAVFQPYTLKNLTLRNRVVMAPMTRSFCPDGVPRDEVAAYYRRRAEGEVGLIVTEGIGIDHPAALGDSGLGDNNQPVIHGDEAVEGWRRVVDEVHAAGGLIAPQLWHQGPNRLQGTGRHPDVPSCRPSGLWGPANGFTSIAPEVAREALKPSTPMTESDIADTIAAYGRSAANAKKVGFDAIAIHGAHGYLIDAFMWPEVNQRTDQWGGDLTNRLRYGVEVLKAIRAAVGEEMPIMFRFSQWKQADYAARIASTPAELEQILGAFSDAGVDIFDASTRRYHEPAFADQDPQLGLAGWTKKLTGKPTMAVGSIGLQSEMFESFGQGGSASSDNIKDVARRVEQGEFDLVGVGRALISDAAWARKTRLGATVQPFSVPALMELA